jgi:hypothetical protein
MPDFMHCRVFEYGVDAEGMFDTGESIPSRSSFAFPGSVSRLFMPSGVILLHVFHTPARGAWLRAGQSLVEVFSKQWKVDLKQESGVGLQGLLAEGGEV